MIYTNESMSGRVLGHTTVIKKSTDGMWTCSCDLCGSEYETPTNRIVSGSAARNGCGCKVRGPLGARPPGPMPKGARPFTPSSER